MATPLWRHRPTTEHEHYTFTWRYPTDDEVAHFMELSKERESEVLRGPRMDEWVDLWWAMLEDVSGAGIAESGWQDLKGTAFFLEVIMASIDAVMFRGKLALAARERGLGRDGSRQEDGSGRASGGGDPEPNVQDVFDVPCDLVDSSEEGGAGEVYGVSGLYEEAGTVSRNASAPTIVGTAEWGNAS